MLRATCAAAVARARRSASAETLQQRADALALKVASRLWLAQTWAAGSQAFPHSFGIGKLFLSRMGFHSPMPEALGTRRSGWTLSSPR